MPVDPSSKDCVRDEMRRFKSGELHSGTGKKGKEGATVKNRKQAIAIALSACGKSKKDYAESLQSLGYSETAISEVLNLLYAETDWQKQFETGISGPRNPDNYKPNSRFQNKGSILDGVDADKIETPRYYKRLDGDEETEMLGAATLEKGSGSPAERSSKQVQGLRMLG